MLIDKINKMKQNYSIKEEVKSLVKKEEIKQVDILEYNRDMAYKVSQINFII